MSRRLSLLSTCGVLGFGGLAFVVAGPLVAGVIILAALYLGAGRQKVLGDTPILKPVDMSPHVLRRYREEHPGATITDAIAATSA